MALSKKHFERIASDIAQEVTTTEQNPNITPAQASAIKIAMRNFAVNFCTFARSENPDFDGQRFLRACGF